MESSFFVKFCARLSSSWIKFCCLCKTRRRLLVLYARVRTVLMDPHSSWHPRHHHHNYHYHHHRGRHHHHYYRHRHHEHQHQGCVISLLKSKSGFSIRNGYFVSLVKSKSRSWIQMIHNGGGFFGSLSKTGYFGHILSVSLLRIRKEWTLPAVTRNNFNT